MQREFRSGYTDLIRAASDRLTPASLCGVFTVVSLYLLLPLVFRLVKDSRIRHSNISLLMDGLALSLGVRDEKN